METAMKINVIKSGASWGIFLPASYLDYDSRKLLKQTAKKLNKKNFKVYLSYPRSKYPTPEEAEIAFMLDTEKKGAIQSCRYNGEVVPTLVIRKNGSNYSLSLTEEAEVLMEEMKQTNNVEKTESAKAVPKTTEKTEGNVRLVEVIVDPTSSKAKSLVGKMVEISKSYSFVDKRVVKLTGIDEASSLPFYGVSTADNKQYSGVFIREHIVRREPFDLSDIRTRDSLRGVWIKNCVTGQECMVTNFRKESNGTYTCNGLDARTLMNSYSFLDGGFLGYES